MQKIKLQISGEQIRRHAKMTPEELAFHMNARKQGHVHKNKKREIVRKQKYQQF